MCEPIHNKLTFRANQLGDGDIFCFQKSPPVQCLQQCRYPDVPSFFEYVHNRLVVHFQSLAKPKEDAFCLQLGADHLSDMLVQNNQTAHLLYYEVLDIPLPELECLKTLEVSFHHATKKEVVKHCITLPEHSTVADLLSDLKRKIPEEEKNCGTHDHIIHVYYFTKDTSQNQMLVQNFCKPFLLVIHDGETLADVKVRIQKKLRVPVPDLCKWKFVYISLGRAEYLQDTDIVSTRFQRRELFAPWEQYLGLEHSDIAPNGLHAANQVMNPSLTAPLIPATAPPTTSEDLELSMAIAASIHSPPWTRDHCIQMHTSVLVSKPVDWINSSENSSTPNNRGPTRGPASPLESSSSRWSYKPAQVGYNGWDVPEGGPSNRETQQSIPSTCVICLDAPIEGACIPCGHLSGCMSCLNEIQGKKLGCPVCHAKIKQVVKIYAV